MNTEQNRDLDMPEGLDEKGKKAHQIIVEYLKANNLTTTDMQAFFSPTEWRSRGEEYGGDSHLVIVYDGATSLKRVFSLDGCYRVGLPEEYVHYEAMQQKLGEAGFFFEECTCYFAAVYTS